MVCPPTSSACVATRGVFQDLEVVTRECGPPGPPGNIPGCRTRVLGGGASATICACAGDLCNLVAGAETSLLSVELALAVTLSVLVTA